MLSANFKPIIAFLIVIFLITVNSNGQSRWESAEIFLNNTESFICEVDIIKTESNYQNCYYRLAGTKVELTLSADHLARFSLVGGREFITKTVLMDEDSVTVIAEFLVEGVIDVLVFHDGVAEKFIMDAPGKPITVFAYEIVDKRLKGFTEKTAKAKSFAYIGKMKYLMSNSPELHGKISSMPLSTKNLVKISMEYHEKTCAPGEQCIVYSKDGFFQCLLLLQWHQQIYLS